MNLFKLHCENERIFIYNGNKQFSINLNKEITHSTSQLLEYFLNTSRYNATVHNKTGFIKCFMDIEKKNYIMAIKITEINTEAEKRAFLDFFDDIPF